MGTLTIVQKIGDFRVDAFLKASSNNHSESYLLTSTHEAKAIMKLYDAEKLNQKKRLTEEGRFLEGDVCRQLETGHLFAHTLSYKETEFNGRRYIYLIREYVEGKRLSDILDSGKRYRWEEAISIFQQVLEGLASLHHQAPVVIHNDITPRNVLLRKDENGNGKVCLIGTGHLSNRINGNPPFSSADLNPWYRAPETFKGIYDEQSDIFSAGALFYTMQTGTEPWKVNIPVGSNLRMVKDSVKKAREKGMDVVDELPLDEGKKMVLKAALSLDYDNRFRSVDDFLKALNGEDVSRYIHNKQKQASNLVEKKEEVAVITVPQEESIAEGIQRQSGGGFAEVAGMEEVKSMFYKDVMFVLNNKEKADLYKLKIPNGILLYGPPGCGKTFIAEKFAQESHLNFMMVKASDLGSIYIHGTQGKIAELFTEAAKKAPTILCLDELDGMVPDRTRTTNEGQAGEVNEFLGQLNNCADRGIFVIGTSNRPDKIDPAILRTGRMDKLVYIPVPDKDARRALFALQLEGRLCEPKIDNEALASLTEGYVASDINFIVNETALEAAMNDQPISQQLLTDNIKRIRKSVTADEMLAYESLRIRMEEGRSEAEQRKIGFATYK